MKTVFPILRVMTFLHTKLVAGQGLAPCWSGYEPDKTTIASHPLLSVFSTNLVRSRSARQHFWHKS